MASIRMGKQRKIMAGKRKLRVFGFVLFNFGLIFSLLTYLHLIEDDCNSCAHLESSNSIEKALKNKTFVNSYRITKSVFKETEISRIFNETNFWNEHVEMVKNSGDIAFKDTMLIWSQLSGANEIKLELFEENGNNFQNNRFGNLDFQNVYPDTVIIDAFFKEKVIQGKLIYEKVTTGKQ
jgi:hypothetical protein